MSTLVIGISNLLIGAAYISLGLLSAWEAASQYRQRGLSRFGLGFSLMAASCGPHHLVHGWCVLQGATPSAPLLVATLIGLPGGLVFCSLRLEAMLGGRGDRTLAVSPHAVAAVTIALLATVGALAAWALNTPVPPAPVPEVCTVLGLRYAAPATVPPATGVDFGAPVVLANLWVTVTYAMVGWYLVETQIRRYIADRSWSLSGLSLATIFPSCAAMHGILALSGGAHGATLLFDLAGVPASVYFLWIVKRLHMDSVVDWNRRPMAGIADQPKRSSPWSE